MGARDGTRSAEELQCVVGGLLGDVTGWRAKPSDLLSSLACEVHAVAKQFAAAFFCESLRLFLKFLQVPHLLPLRVGLAFASAVPRTSTHQISSHPYRVIPNRSALFAEREESAF